MIGFIKGLFGGGKSMDTVVETAASGIYNGLDKLIYTDEEKAEALGEGRKLFLSFVKVAYDQNSIRSVARRWLAFMVVGPTMAAFVIAIVAWPFNPEYSKFLLDMVVIMGPWAAGVLAFYFGPHLLGAMGSKSG